MRISDSNIFYDEKGQFNVKLGSNVEFIDTTENIVLEAPLIISDNVKIGCSFVGACTEIKENCIIDNCISIGRYVTISEGCEIGIDNINEEYINSDFFYDRKWDFCGRIAHEKEHSKGNISIGNNVYVGRNVHIIGPCKINDGAIILNNSYVYCDIPEFSVYGGNPAVFIKERLNEKKIIELRKNDLYNRNPYDNPINEELLAYESQWKPVKFSIDCLDKSIFRCLDSNINKVYDERIYESEVVKGVISKNGVKFDNETRALSIRGWLLPVYAYDEVSAYVDSIFIGNCEIREVRKDVYKSEHELKDIRCGIYLDTQIESVPKEIELIVKKRGTTVKTIKYEYSDKPYVYMLNHLVDVDREYYSDTFSIICEQGERKIWENYFSRFVHIEEEGKFKIDCNQMYKVGTKTLPYWYFILNKGGEIDAIKLMDFSKHFSINAGDVLEILKSAYGEKKVICIYGNCQSGFLTNISLTSHELKQNYIFLKIPNFIRLDIQLMEEIIKEGVLNRIDYFIYQNIKKDNKRSELLSTEFLLGFLNDNCRKCCIPNCYFEGYFPQSTKPMIGLRDKILGVYVFYGNSVIDSLYKNHSVEEITKKLLDINYYDKETCVKNVERSIEELKSREKICDVIISDYIEDNYKIKYLFYTRNHPNNETLFELLKRIYDFLYIKYGDIKWNTTRENDKTRELIFPSVINQLNLNFNYDGKVTREDYEDGAFDLTVSQYVRMYVNMISGGEDEKGQNGNLLSGF